MADGTVTIDVLMGTKSFMSDRERVENLLKTLGADAGNQMDEAFTNNSNKVQKKARETKKKIKNEFDSPIIIKLEAKAKEAGVKDFRKILNQIPRNQLTRLKAKSERDEVIDWKKEISRIPEKKSTRLKVDKKQASDDLTALKKQSESTEHSFSHLKEIVVGTFLGGAIQAGVQGLVTGLKDAAKAGMEYNKQQDMMRMNWHNLTTEAPKDGEELLTYINHVSQHSIYAADTIDKMAQSFYHVHSSEKETKKWTDDFVALGSTLHVSNDALKESGEQFAKIVAGGKTSAEDMSVMISRFPMFGEALQKATGKSMSQLYAMSAAGKLTSKQFTEALDYLGKKYRGSTEEAMNSFQGMSMYIKSRWSMLTGNIMASSFKMSKGVAQDMRNLLSDNMMKKYADLASTAISHVTGWLVELIKYVNAHKNTIVDIIGNLGKILGIIGKTVWKTFSDIVYDIAKMFGLVGEKAQESKDPLDKIDDALKNLSKNQELIENLTKAFIAMFALKKGMEFIGMLASLRKSLIETAAVSKMVDLFGGSGVTSAGGKAVTQTVAKEAGGTAATAGSSKVLGRLFAKGGATSTAELEAASGLGGGKAMMAARGLTKAVPYMSIAASIPELFGTTQKTLGKHLGGFAGSAGGPAAGAAAGSAVMPVVGTAVGGVIGGLAGSKLGQSVGGSIQKGITKSFPKLTSKMSDLGHDMAKKFSGSFKPKPSLNDKQFSKSYTSLTKTLNKQAKIKIKTDTSGISKAQKLTDTTYGKMKKSVDKYYGHKRQMSIKDYATLVQNGSMTEKEANKLLNKAKENYNKQAKAQKDNIGKMKKDSDSYYSKLGKAESQKNKDLAAARKKDGKNHEKYLADKKKIEKDFQTKTAGDRKKYLAQLAKDENKSNDAVTKATKISSGKQLDILENLKDHKGKLSKQQMTETIKNSAQERDKTIDNADKQRDKSVSAAKKKYKETVDAADKERYENGTMSRKQYEEVVDKARQQRDDSIDAADAQKKKTVKKAEETHTKVVDEATKQAGEHKGAVDSETGDVITFWGTFISTLRGDWNDMTGGINSILHALNKNWGNIPTWKKHAAGLNGSMGEHTALVGEEGFEYMGTSNGSIMPIGVEGPEIRNIPAGASILPHGMSVEFAQMAKDLPGYKIGLPGWLTSTFSALKKGAEGAADLVSEGASGVVNKIANATGIGKLAKTLNDNTTAFGAIASGAKDSLIDNAVKYVQGFFDQFSDTSEDGAGSLAPHFGSPFKESSGYGPRAGGFHKGIDFAAPLGTPIPAQYGGTVVQAGPASGFGNWVVIKPSGASVDTIYGHMKRMKVKTGQHVKAGQIIAWVGSEGQSSGPHVHYELRAGLGGKSYNPMTYGASAGNPCGHSVNRWRPYVVRALKANGFAATDSQVAAWMKVIKRESNGDPSVINTWDRNAQLGHPSKGLVQTIQPTFDAYKFKGHNNPLNGYDDLLAGIHYMKAIYGSGPSAFARVSGPMGYDSGGRVMKKQLAWLAENNPEYVVNPERDSADSLIVEAARARAAKAPNGLVAKAMRVVGTAKAGIQRTAPSFASRGVAQAEGQVAGNQAISGDLTITVPLDSNVLAQAVYPKAKVMQQRDITIQAKKGGLH
ncbi:tail length tape measure protein [Lactobacillus phage phig1e]|uniref:tail length tape measure protein n=1 Tax=Lactobacillus phage phig1e TaxID=52979 RepID=UPI000009C1F4|nr:tail length tape measure protein [Lactobacillus phage phig1e]pir/T13216/ minor capsid protein 1608 - Lactobacillus phage phi-gle [Lactobacillus phage phi-gle]CAA66745.1 minor capsid protein [Lactobacillus phage phig1e]